MLKVKYGFFCLMLVLPCVAFAGLEEGLAALNKKEYEAARQELQPLAEQGDSKAQAKMGYLYFYGWSVSQDYKQAAEWFRKAAQQGQAELKQNLA